MKHFLYFVFGLLLLAGCSKKADDPTPVPTPPAQAVAGLYTMSSITTNGQTCGGRVNADRIGAYLPNVLKDGGAPVELDGLRTSSELEMRAL